MIQPLGHILRSFWKDEDGTASLEFALVAPAFLIIFVSAVESGLLLTRQVMLERGMDMAVRDVRLATATPPDYNTLRQMICDNAAIMPSCMTDLKLEMVRIDPWGYWYIEPEADCINREEPNAPVREFSAGQENEMVYLRACIQFRPIFPTVGLGFKIADKRGEYKLVADSVFVAEPMS